MKQITYELFRINANFKVKFSVVMKYGDDSDNLFTDKEIGKFNNSNKSNGVFNKYEIDGNTYYKFVPHPRIIIDIKPYNLPESGYSLNYSVSFNRFELYWFMKKLSKFYNNFEMEGLFYINSNDEPSVNYELVKNKNLTLKHVAQSGLKHIEMNYIIFRPNGKFDSESNVYDGALFSINSGEYVTCLSKDEVGFLLYELNKIDLNVLLTQAINTYILLYKDKSEGVEIQNSESSVSETDEQREIIDVRPLTKDESVLPDI